MNLRKALRRFVSSARLLSRGRRLKARSRNRRAPRLESLEARAMFAADLRSYDGTGNNPVNVDWGSTDEQLLRLSPAAYTDGMSSPSGADRPGARAVSNAVAAHPDEAIKNNRDLTPFIYAWGQFLDHDIDLTGGASPAESFNIPIPTGDPQFDPNSTGTKVIPLSRSIYDPATGTAIGNPRNQLNQITAFVDGSQIYGSDATRAAALRTFSGGRMKTSAGDLMPFNTMGLANASLPGQAASSMFVAGDIRANENTELMAMHTLFLREHNRVADQLAARNPTWSDEQLYQQARKIVGAELQAITFNEFLPALLGEGAIGPYRGYNPKVNPGIANEFSTAAFRIGHSLLGDDIEFLDNQGNEVHDPVALRDAFFNTGLLQETGIDPILKYLATDKAEELDTKVVDDVRNFLFGPPGAGGFDLAALNIQRGRDHGLADYNTVRKAYGLKPVTSFADITRNVETQDALKSVYSSVDKIDLWVGGLAEDHVPGSSVGPTFQRILGDQFSRLRDGDRFWYERTFQGGELDALRRTTLADVIRRNSHAGNLQNNVFFFRASIAGRVFVDGNNNGRLDPLDPAAAGITVNLLDTSGNVLASVRTNGMGEYRFDHLDPGAYRVRIVLPAGARQTTGDPADIRFARPDAVDRVDFGIVLLPPVAPKKGPLMGGV